MTPDDLVPLADAARRVERSTRTLRRWITAGKLERFEGAPPVAGGSSVALVSARAVHALVIAEGQEPRQAGPDTAGQAKAGGAPVQPDVMDKGADTSAVQLAELRAAVTEADLRGQLATLRAERDALADRLADVRGQLADARADREDWRARHDAARAELEAMRATLRQREGIPWWRRLIGGPVAELQGPADG